LLGLADVLGYQMVIPLVEDPSGSIERKFLVGRLDARGKKIPVTWEVEKGYYYEENGKKSLVAGYGTPEHGSAEIETVKFTFRYKEDQPCVYFPADTVLPSEWAEKFGIKQLLKGKDNDRVGRIRLRGEPSFGLVVDIPEGVDWKVGDNVCDYFGAKKFEPPIRATCGDAAPRDPLIDPFVQKYTDIENGRIFVDVFQEGEEVVCTEKIHGTNCKIGLVMGQRVAGSMEVRRKKPVAEGEDPNTVVTSGMKSNTYWFPWTLEPVQNLLLVLSKPADGRNPCVLLYGEVYGGSVQGLDYGIPKGKGLGFVAFDLMVDGEYLDWDDFKAKCDSFGVETVPVLYRGSFNMAKVKEIADGNTVTAGNHIREGTVVKPIKERVDPKIGRVVLKYIGTEYALSKHQDKDNKDV